MRNRPPRDSCGGRVSYSPQIRLRLDRAGNNLQRLGRAGLPGLPVRSRGLSPRPEEWINPGATGLNPDRRRSFDARSLLRRAACAKGILRAAKWAGVCRGLSGGWWARETAARRARGSWVFLESWDRGVWITTLGGPMLFGDQKPAFQQNCDAPLSMEAAFPLPKHALLPEDGPPKLFEEVERFSLLRDWRSRSSSRPAGRSISIPPSRRRTRIPVRDDF